MSININEMVMNHEKLMCMIRHETEGIWNKKRTEASTETKSDILIKTFQIGSKVYKRKTIWSVRILSSVQQNFVHAICKNDKPKPNGADDKHLAVSSDQVTLDCLYIHSRYYGGTVLNIYNLQVHKNLNRKWINK